MTVQDPRPRWTSPLAVDAGGEPLPTHGARVCAWIEAHCRYGEGDYFGKKVELRPWQRRFIKRLYQYDPATNKRRYRRALLGMAKGNGKSPLAAFVGVYELLGGQKVAPRVMIGAASLKQANLVFGDLKTAIVESDSLADMVSAQELQVVLREDLGPGLAERVAAEAATNDGARATAFIADELHEWTGRVERVFLIVDGAIAKREDAFTLGISTAGVAYPRSLLKELYDHGIAVSNGEIVDDGFLFEWFEADPALELEDEQQWLEAVMQANPAAGDFLSIDNLKYRFATIPRFEFERYHLNRWTAAAASFLPPGAWDARARTEVAPAKGEEIVLAFRGSYSHDAAGIVGATKDGHIFVVANFEGEARAEDVDAAASRAFEHWSVVHMSAVATGWHGVVEAWAERYGEDVVIAYPLSSPAKRAAACSKFYSAVMEGELTHDGNAALARHLNDARTRSTEHGPYIVEDASTANRPIHLATAAVIAFETRGESVQRRSNEAVFF